MCVSLEKNVILTDPYHLLIQLFIPTNLVIWNTEIHESVQKLVQLSCLQQVFKDMIVLDSVYRVDIVAV